MSTGVWMVSSAVALAVLRIYVVHLPVSIETCLLFGLSLLHIFVAKVCYSSAKQIV